MNHNEVKKVCEGMFSRNIFPNRPFLNINKIAFAHFDFLSTDRVKISKVLRGFDIHSLVYVPLAPFKNDELSFDYTDSFHIQYKAEDLVMPSLNNKVSLDRDGLFDRDDYAVVFDRTGVFQLQINMDFELCVINSSSQILNELESLYSVDQYFIVDDISIEAEVDYFVSDTDWFMSRLKPWVNWP